MYVRRENCVCWSRHLEVVGGATIPADHEDGEVGRHEGGGPRKKVEAVGEQHCRFPPKTASGVKSKNCKWGKK